MAARILFWDQILRVLSAPWIETLNSFSNPLIRYNHKYVVSIFFQFLNIDHKKVLNLES